MGRILSADGLPPPLISAVRPWIGVVETATLGMGDELRATTENAGASLRRRIVMNSPLEAALEDARGASLRLAAELDAKGAALASARSAAVTALGVLLVLLASAAPNERAKGLGLGW